MDKDSKQVVVLLTHPNIKESRANKALMDAISDMGEVAIYNLYEMRVEDAFKGGNHIPRCGRRRHVASCSDGDHRTQPVRRIWTDRYRSASAGERRIFIHRVCRCRLHRFRRV